VAVLPLYQYKCEKCNHEFELKKSFKDDSNHVHCPECGEHAGRVFVPPAIIFKGSGFYVTDYKKNATLPSVNSDKPKEESKKAAPAAKAEKKTKAKDSKE
jgi:putative FmdB family regulatory protein